MTTQLQYENVIRDGKVAILYSPDFGAGWSTWSNANLAEFLRTDSGLVALAERKAETEEVKKYLDEKGMDDVYLGGWSDIDIEWLPVGTEYYIHEYDGSESVMTKESHNWSVA